MRGALKRPNIKTARLLRQNQTDAEGKLWRVLRNRNLCGAKFRRQFPAGGFILDFYAPEYKLCVEVDGGQHYLDGGLKCDETRDKKLSMLGIKVVRFANSEILTNIQGVCEFIMNTLDGLRKKPASPSPQSSPPSIQGGRGGKPLK